jgi:hypothetical protein
VPVEPDVYEAVRACLPAQEAAILEAIRTALRQVLATVAPPPQDDTTHDEGVP